MDYQAAAVNVAEKLMSQTNAVGGTLNKTGDICHNEGFSLACAYNSQNGRKCCEVIVCYLGLCGGNHRNKRGFSDVGEAHKSYVRKELKLKSDLEFLAEEARFCEFRYLTGGCGKSCVALAALAAVGDYLWLIVGHIRNDAAAFGVLDESSSGDFYNKIGSISAGAV